MSTVLARLESLERRVAALEVGAVAVPEARRPAPEAPAASRPVPVPEVVRAREVPAPRPAPVRAHVLPAAPARLPTEPSPPRDLEAWVGSVLLGRVGIGAVVLAAAYFAQLAYRNVSDDLKVLSLYLLAGALVAAGRVLRPRIGERYVALLWGGGVAVAYIAGLAATLRYGLVDAWTGLVLLAGAAAVGQVLARSLRTEVIATVSLVSAISAPFLLGVAQSEGLVLLAYAAGIHLWAAWTSHAWGWRTAGGVALAGVGVLAFAWATGPGLGTALADQVALHVLVLVVLAPSAASVLRGGGPRRDYVVGLAVGLAVLEASLLLHDVPRDGSDGLRGLAVLAGLVWLGAATALAPRAGEGPGRPLVRMLATVGGVVAVLGLPALWQEDGLPAGLLVSLAVAAPALVVLRRRVGAGDLAAFVASLVALGAAVAGAFWVCRPGHGGWAGAGALLLAVALVPAGSLVAAGRSAFVRVAGLVAGAATLGFVLLVPADLFTTAWGAAALALPAAWAVAAHLRARRTGDRTLGQASGLLVLGLAVLWVCTSLGLGRGAPWPRAFDPQAWSALALAGAALFLRSRGLARGPGRPVDLVNELMAAALGLVLLAGGREVHLLTRHLAAGAHSVALVLYGAAAGLALAAHARVGARLGRARLALLCLGAAGLGVVVHAANHPLDATLVVGLLGTGLASVVAAELLLRRDGERPEWLGLAVAPFLPLALAWVLASAEAAGRIPHALANARSAGGFGLTALLALATARSLRLDVRPALRWTLGSGALLMGYVAGLLELLTGVHELQSSGDLKGAWGPVLVSLYTVLVAGGMLWAGFRWKAPPLRWAALVVLGLVVAKVGLHDLAASGLPLRVLVTGVLGLVLLSGAYAYTKRRRAAAAGG